MNRALNRVKMIKLAMRRLKCFFNYSNYIRRGTYLTTHNLKGYYLNSSEIEKFVQSHLSFIWSKKPLRVLNFRNKNGSGDILLFSNTEVEKKPASIKVFHIAEGYVETIYNDVNKMEQDLEGYHKFSSHFKTPQLLRIDETSHTIKEEIILGSATEKIGSVEKNQFYKNIILYYSEYFAKNSCTGVLTYFDLISRCEETGMPKNIIKIMRNGNTDEMFPCYFLHGDLSPTNVLEKKGNPVFIDFEHCGSQIFFYDSFWYIKDYFTQFCDSTLLENYMKGEFDTQYRLMFDAVSLQYKTDHRKKYIYAFLMCMYLERGINLENTGRLAVLNNIQQIINAMEGARQNENA